MDHIQGLNNNAGKLESHIIDLCINMPALSLDIAWMLSFLEREKVTERINKHIESQIPASKRKSYF